MNGWRNLLNRKTFGPLHKADYADNTHSKAFSCMSMSFRISQMSGRYTTPSFIRLIYVCFENVNTVKLTT